MTGGDFIKWSAHKEFCCISVSGGRPSETLEMSDGLTADKEKATETGWKEWQPEGPRRKSKWYLNSEIVEEICQERRKEMETEKETEQRELEGWREWLILLLRVHISSPPPPPLSLSLSLSRAEAICTWVPHLRRQPSHNYPQMAVATSVTHGKAGLTVKLCMLQSASHLS